MRVLFVEPDFPIPSKSRNHKNFLPIGLLKLHGYYDSLGHKTKLIRGNLERRALGTRFNPDLIMITSLFTYWAEYVRQCVAHYRNLFPNTKVIVGGIYASLMPEHCKDYTGCHEVFVGIHREAEEYASKHKLDYSVLENSHPLVYQIVHASRGCFRRCGFCGTWRIEPKPEFKRTVVEEIQKRRLIFYDNNLLANPFIRDILRELAAIRGPNHRITCESQSGFDGRILLRHPVLASMLRDAGFIEPRIAWDQGYGHADYMKRQIDVLTRAGFEKKRIFIFMLYNHDVPFIEMERKRIQCWRWSVQISDCRYRPLDQTYDNYQPNLKEQTSQDYYIHPQWTDQQIRQFRRNVRRQNICVRQDIHYYSRALENMETSKTFSYEMRSAPYRQAKHVLPDAWSPGRITFPKCE